MTYTGGTKGAESRAITHHTLIEEYGTLCVIARCHIYGMNKYILLDRNRGYEPLTAGRKGVTVKCFEVSWLLKNEAHWKFSNWQ